VRVVIFEPDKPGRITEINNTLKDMQEIVGGYIETITLAGSTVIVCNEEGITLELPENRLGIYGTFFICRVKGDKFVGLAKSTANALIKII